VTQGGLLVIDKPIGPTSHDVVAKVRKKLGTRRVGHAGTLDPDASGLLLICVGEATRLLEYMTATEKGYTGTCRLGIGTDTDDAAGSVTATASASHLTEKAIAHIRPQFLGEIQQFVPRYSAVHIDGKRAYDLARSGVEFVVPERTIHIAELTFTHVSKVGETCDVDFYVRCSKGTYIRSLCRDIGIVLGVPAHMSSLRRVSSGHLTEAQSVSLETWLSSDDPQSYLHNPLSAMQNVCSAERSLTDIDKLAMGQALVTPPEIFQTYLQKPMVVSEGQEVLILHQGEIAAVTRVTELAKGSVTLRPRKVFFKREQP
jgi:tRNA pseudouridine55 synthase